jgi:DNA primase
MNFDQISVESILDAAGATYKVTPGASGPQINVRECPRCGDSRYKVYLNRETGLGNCWVCPPGANTFSKFSLAQALFRTDKRQTFQRLESLLINARWMTPAIRELERQVELRLPDSVPLPYQGMLPTYLIDRGITSQTADYFEVRYCQDGVFEDATGRRLDFSQRIIFPVRDVSGRLVSFQGRDVTNQSRVRYLFPPGFSVSGKVLYNAHNATQADTLILTEGVFDCMAVKQALLEVGWTHIEPIASFGKHFAISRSNTDDQLDVLLKLRRWFGIENIWFAWDGTPDAQLAAIQTMRKLQRSGFKTKLIDLPAGTDPNEIPSHQLIDCIHRAVDYSDNLLVQLQLAGIRP